MATKVTGGTTSYYTSWYTYDITVNNATTYTFKINLGVTSTDPTSATALDVCGIHKKIGSGSWSNTNMGSTKTIKAKGDTTLISGNTWPITKTHSTQTVTIEGAVHVRRSGATMSAISYATKTFTVPAKTSYKVTYNANSGSGAPAQQTKWHDEPLTLSSTKPTKEGYIFKGWATSEANAKEGSSTYQPGDTVLAGTNSALNLWAVWELIYSKPTITNLHVERCKASGEVYDEGTIARVTFDWSVFRSSNTRYYGGSTTPYASTTVQSCSVQVGTVTKTVSLSGTSGSTSNNPVIVGSDGSFLNDQQYNVSVTITDTVDSTVQSVHSSTASTTLATTFFPMDFNANASAVGFFGPAPDDKEGVYMGKSLFVRGNAMAQGFAGMIQMFAGTTEPAGWLFCDGTTYNVSDYPELAAVLGSTYGGDGENTFAVPDMRGRFPLGVSASHALATPGGAETVTLTAAQSGMRAHTHAVGSHYHNLYNHHHTPNTTGENFLCVDTTVSNASFTISTSGNNRYTVGYSSTGHFHARSDTGNPDSNNTGNTTYSTRASNGTLSGTAYTGGVKDISEASATSAHNNMPPYIGINFIIATGKTS